MNLTTFPGSGADVEEPNWGKLIPDQNFYVYSEERFERANHADLREVAHREWLRIVAELRANDTLSPANRHQIQRLVIAYVRYDRAAAKQFELGPVLPSPKTMTPMVNLWQTEMRQADADAMAAEMELGITPRRRGSTTKAKRAEKTGRASDRFLRPIAPPPGTGGLTKKGI